VEDAPAAAEVLAAPAAADAEDVEDALEDDAADGDAAGTEPLEDEAAAVPPIGAVDWPSICACTVALNVPDMPLILINTHVNIKTNKSRLGNHTRIWRRMQEPDIEARSNP
jgi:hypothetical protein